MGCFVLHSFSHYKSMGIFPDAQGQLTPQSEIKPGRNSNSSEMLWLSLLPARMKKIHSIRAVAGQRSSPDLCFATTSVKIYDP